MWALIYQGTVVQVAAGQFPVAPGMEWVACAAGTLPGDLYDGTTFSHPASAAPGLPTSVSMAQAKIALHRTPGSTASKTMLDDVNTAVAAADPTIGIAWEYAGTVERHGPLVVQMQPLVGLTDAQLDALFAAAATVTI